MRGKKIKSVDQCQRKMKHCEHCTSKARTRIEVRRKSPQKPSLRSARYDSRVLGYRYLQQSTTSQHGNGKHGSFKMRRIPLRAEVNSSRSPSPSVNSSVSLSVSVSQWRGLLQAGDEETHSRRGSHGVLMESMQQS